MIQASEHRSASRIARLIADTLIDFAKYEDQLADTMEESQSSFAVTDEVAENGRAPRQLRQSRLKNSSTPELRSYLESEIETLEGLADTRENKGKRATANNRRLRLLEELAGRDKASSLAMTSAPE